MSNDRAWIGGKVSIQEFNITTGNSFTWVDEMGTSRVSRQSELEMQLLQWLVIVP